MIYSDCLLFAHKMFTLKKYVYFMCSCVECYDTKTINIVFNTKYIFSKNINNFSIFKIHCYHDRKICMTYFLSENVHWELKTELINSDLHIEIFFHNICCLCILIIICGRFLFIIYYIMYYYLKVIICWLFLIN